jgi:NDP-sugar pyrophosphorylase family protein
MKAMVLAAGLGTRLRPLTDHRPKALVEIDGRTLLEITLKRLRSFGVAEVIVNAHHFADMIVAYLATNSNFGMHIEVSREEILLDTGGGLKKAADFFLRDKTNAEQPFLLHNVDVISTIDLKTMIEYHQQRKALVTLAVQKRQASRSLLFDQAQQLCGRRTKDGRIELVRDSPGFQALAFCGIHVISRRFLELMIEEGAFSILTAYLRLAAPGERVLAFLADQYYWRDLGKAESLEQAARDVSEGVVRV